MRARSRWLVGLLVCAALAGCARGGADYDAAGQGGARDAGATRDASVPPDASAAPDATVMPADSGAARDAGPPPADAPAIVVRCGDGIIDAPEVCDDLNAVGGDGCSADCLSVECTGARTFEDPVTHHCYWRETAVRSRTSAIAGCSYRGGHLVRWASTAERDAAYGPTLGGPGGRVWIGLTRVGATWTWDDGEASTTFAADFRSGEPSGDGTCVEWGPSNSLNDIPCGEDRDFVCEREPAGTRR